MQHTRQTMLSVFIIVLFCFDSILAVNINHSSINSNLNDILQADPYKTLIDLAQKNTNFTKLEYLCDTFGPRFCGTKAYSDALDWILATMKQENLENVHSEDVANVTNWIRGEESLTLLEPRVAKLALLGLGTSIGTGANGITAEVLVVSSFDDLKNKSSKAAGKIIVFNAPFTSYGETVIYRAFGASRAAQVGGVASLVRSITPFSLYTPHTGGSDYEEGIKKIPTAAITVEDAEMFARFQERGQKVVVKLFMGAITGKPVTERNIIAEIKGSEYPDQIVLFGGHSDSWDVGQGAMDDGGGLFSTWEAIRLMHYAVTQGLIPRPKRTMRLILWTNEELGQRGADAYLIEHRNELSKHIVAIESDTGNFNPTGFGWTDNNTSSPILPDIINQAGKILSSIGVGNITAGGEDTDNGFLFPYVPGLILTSEGFNPEPDNVQAAYYFFYHHSHADTVTSLNRNGLKKSVAAFAVMTYYIADAL